MPKDKTSSNPTDWERRFRRLVTMMIFSGALNISFIGTFIWLSLSAPSPKTSEKKVTQLSPTTNEELLSLTCKMRFDQLVSLLGDKTVLEQGLTKRDLALSSLVAFHYFDLPRALGRPLMQRRKISFYHPEGGERIEVEVYPSLAEFEFAAIIRFAKTEKWPMSGEGLFYELQRSLPPFDPSLIEALGFAHEIRSLEKIFSFSELPLNSDTLLEIISSFSWEKLCELTKEPPLSKQQACELRRELLLHSLENHNPIAARILIETEGEWLFRRATDAHLEKIFSLTQLQTPKFQQLARDILTSPRSDPICEKAAELLYRFAGELPPQTYDHQKTVAHFNKAVETQQEPLPLPAPIPVKKENKIVHVVVTGDSLWKIARDYGVSIEALIEENNLSSERLLPGKKLVIPE